MTTSLAVSPGPFTINKSFALSAVIDGTSNTVGLSEVMNPFNNGGTTDHRGDIFNDDQNCAYFTAYTTPNSTIQDQMTSTTYCSYPYLSNPPCNGNSPGFNAARSFHAGGVNACMLDGSVRFIKSSINVNTWRGLSTMLGMEVIDANSY